MAKNTDSIELGTEMADAFDTLLFSIMNDTVEDCFLVEGQTTKDCQSQTIEGLVQRNWDMGDCRSVALSEEKPH